MVGVGLVICRRGFIDPRVLKASSRIAFVRTHDGIHMNSFAAAEASDPLGEKMQRSLFQQLSCSLCALLLVKT